MAQDQADVSSPETTPCTAMAHHGELIQGVFEDDNGRLHRGLVTLPIQTLRSSATFEIERAGELTVLPSDKEKARRAAELTLAYLGFLDTGGLLRLAGDIPVGHGYGSSTADVIASIRAAAAAVRASLPPSTISRIAVAAEYAADATAFETSAVLFAHREGEVIEDFGGSLPPFILIGCKPAMATTVDTLRLKPARYTLEEVQLFRVLRGLVARAVRDQDPRLLGRAATISATINQRHLPKEGFDFVSSLPQRNDVLGVQVAHSGTLCGVLVDPSNEASSSGVNKIRAELATLGFRDIGVFAINGAGGHHVT